MDYSEQDDRSRVAGHLFCAEVRIIGAANLPRAEETNLARLQLIGNARLAS